MTLRLPVRFRSLQSKLTTLYTALFAVIALAVVLVAHIMIVNHAREVVRAEMQTSGVVYDRLWSLRTESLTNAAGVLARDFGFRSAVASGDKATIESALVSLGQRAGVSTALVVDTNGDVMGNAGPLRGAVSQLPSQLGADQHAAVIVTHDGIYRLVVSPIMAPTEIGLVVFAVKLDTAEMRALQRLSAIPLTATILQREGAHWIAPDDKNIASPELDALLDQQGPRQLAQLSLGGTRSYALAKRLEAPGKAADAAILLSYSSDAAIAPYAPLQLGLLLVSIAGMVLVFWGSRKLARGIASPVVALREAALSLEEGTRTELAVSGDDEVGDLSAAFNRMSAGILEREHRISHMAFHDALTGLPNRAFFHQQLEQGLARAQRTSEQIAVLCLDLDRFKVINDTLGHPTGDALLRSVAALLQELASDALVARLGGDEFAIVLAGAFAPDRPRALAQAICDRFAQPVLAGPRFVASGTSIGVVIGPANGDDAETLLKNADLALYRAKEDGRACFRFFDTSLDDAARHRHQIELDLREAVQNGQFVLNYQPIFDLKSDRISGFEALVRWYHPVRGLVSPVEFIPVAEETGLILSIGEWVLREACREAAKWPGNIRIAVNVSPLQFRSPGFSGLVMHALASTGLAPSRLEVEITESVFLDGEDQVVDVLHQLRNLGIRVALDDFGTGYSSLSYLRRFPFDKIKIDRSFVTDVAEDSGAAAIVRAIVDLATALHMDTTAEGVEDNDQLDRLRSQGCGSIQGFLFSRPIEAGKIAAMLNVVRSKAA